MLTWAEIILAVLKLINASMSAVNQEKWMQAGRDEEIAKAAQDILAKTRTGKQIMDRINALSDADVDAELRGLEPK